MKIRGLILIVIAAAIPWLWYAPLMGRGDDALGQYLGVVSLILMSITQLLATRITGIEAIFGSLDRIYILHKWLAVGALITAFLHENIGAELDGVTLVRRLGDTAEEIGELAYNGFIFLIIISLITIIPYKYWKWSHRFIGVFFALASFHYFFIEKPYGTFEPIGLYTTAFCLIGILSYLYLLIPRTVGHNTHTYQISNIVQHPHVTEISLKPQSKAITHKAGQFAFINFKPLHLRETHPFTISSAPQKNGELRFMVKGLGSYTKRLGHSLTTGTTTRVSKAFGHFSLRPTTGPQVWIGAGIGITPFMAWAGALTPQWTSPTHLYYCVRSPQEALSLNEFEATAQQVGSFDFTLIASNQGKRLSTDKIIQDLPQSNLKQLHVYFCGPTAMRDALKQGLMKAGLPRTHFHYEAFEMRTSLGLIGLIRRLKLAVTT